MSSFLTVPGIHLDAREELSEGYDISSRPDGSYRLRANVSAEHIDPLFRALAQLIPCPGFLILEIPCNEAKEATLRTSAKDPLHRDVYFLDGLSSPDFLSLYDAHSEVWINDGHTHYGFGSHGDRSEIFVGSYKIFSILCSDAAPYRAVLENFGLKESSKLLTAWDILSTERPGKRMRWTDPSGRDTYAIADDLMTHNGLYCSKTITG